MLNFFVGLFYLTPTFIIEPLFLLFDSLLRLPRRQHLRQLVVQPVLDAIGDANLVPQAGEGGLVLLHTKLNLNLYKRGILWYNGIGDEK